MVKIRCGLTTSVCPLSRPHLNKSYSSTEPAQVSPDKVDELQAHRDSKRHAPALVWLNRGVPLC